MGLPCYPAILLGAMGTGNAFVRYQRTREQRSSWIPSVHCHTAPKHWVPYLVPCTATLLCSNAQWESFSAVPHYLGAVSRCNPPLHRHNDAQ